MVPPELSQPQPLVFFPLPVATTLAVLWLLVSFKLPMPVRSAGVVAAFLIGGCFFNLLRLEGITGAFDPQWAWRFSPEPVDRYEAQRRERQAASDKPAAAAQPVTEAAGDWPGFRGPRRDARVSGVRLSRDWSTNPPKKIWSQLIGPGWSSFAVIGDRLFTQEQRKNAEAVVCLEADTGKEIWAYEFEGHFNETVSGPGPRATPTYHDGRIYALSAQGLLHCLDAVDGKHLWSKNAQEESGAKMPTWAHSSSPLVWHGVVSVFAGGPDDKSVLGYDARTGELKWSAGKGTNSYCSPHPATIDGVDQILIATSLGVTSIDPVKGTVLWQYDWKVKDMVRVVQPNLVGDTDFLVGTGFNLGIRRVSAPVRGRSEPTLVWESQAISPYFNDLVVHKGHLYGFDGQLFTCVSLEDGASRWRKRGYGSGQVLLIEDQDLLLVVSEQGQVALLETNPEKCVELGRFQALKGKTWNHPVISHGKLFVRNADEIACYDLGQR
jgi:hypothetical protein